MAAAVYYSPVRTNSSPSKSLGSSPSYSEVKSMAIPKSWPMSHHAQHPNSSGSTSGTLAGVSRRNASLTGIHRQNKPRPLSMPSHHLHVHANALAALDSYCLDAEEISPVPPPSFSPTKVTTRLHQADGGSTPTPTCAPWISNMAIKKLKSKIGKGIDDKILDNLSPLRFHSVHGDNIEMLSGGSAVRRIPIHESSYCKGIVFSDRAVKVNERICIKVIGSSTEFSGGIRLGFTNQDPSTFRYSLPDRAIPELVKRLPKGVWAKALLDESALRTGAIFFYYVTQAGKVCYGINGKKVATFLKYVDTRKPLWALLDVYGNTTAIELVDPKAHLNNSRKNLEDRDFEDVDSGIGPSMNSLILAPSQVQLSPTKNSIQVQDLAFNNLQIHPTCGKNAQLNKFRNVAWRAPKQCGNAYVFTSRPLEVGETIVIQVQQSDEPLTGSMAFGLTSADPESLNPKSLPDDSYYLVDRPEYWIFKKDAVSNLSAKDELAFTLTPSGTVNVSKNRGLPTALMQVDLTCPLYAFFDLYGSTQKLSLMGSILPRIQRPIQQQQSPLLTTSRTVRNVVPAQSSSVSRASNFVSSPSRMSLKHPMRCAECSHTSLELHKCQTNPGGSPATSPVKLTQQCSRPQLYEKLNINQKLADPRLSPQATMIRIIDEKYESLNSSPTKKQNSPEKAECDGKNWSVDCVACCRRPVNSLFSPCGHLTMCYDCAYDYWNARPDTCCPICRQRITDVIPISKTS